MRYSLKDLSRPEFEPVTLDEAKAHLRVTSDDENSFIESLITSAREYCEGFTKRSLAVRQWRLSFDTFPHCSQHFIGIPRPPLVSIDSIAYLDSNGDSAEMASSDVLIDSDSEPGVISLPFGGVWPVARCQRNSVTVTYTAGFEADECPEKAKQAMKLLIGHWFNNREDVITGIVSKSIEVASEALLWQLKFDL